MKIKSYKYQIGQKKDGKVIIDSIDRKKFTSQVFDNDMISYIKSIKPSSEKVAVLVAGGPAIHHSDTRNVNNLAVEGSVVVRSQIGYNSYSIARLFQFNIDYISINTNTCASSMYCLYEAKRLFQEGYTDVLIVAVDLVDDTQELLFKQLGIDLVCGDCISVTHLSNDGMFSIDDVVWKWNKDSSPMSVSKEGYDKVISSLDTSCVDFVKMHGSGTERNTEMEIEAIRARGMDAKCVGYKQEIGHTQGCSTIVEVCMMLDREKFTKSLVLASGLGGFYGGCIITKG